MVRSRTWIIGCALAALASPALAAEPFEVSVAGGPTAGSDSISALLSDLLEGGGDFAQTGARSAYTASLSYLGVEDAIVVASANSGRSVTVTIPSTGYSKTFTGTDSADVAAKVQAWLQESGDTELSRFQTAVNGKSRLALLDGNPRATTGLLARGAMQRFGTDPSLGGTGFTPPTVTAPGSAPNVAGTSPWRAFELRMDAWDQYLQTEQLDGLRASGGTLTLGGYFSERVGLSLAVTGQVRRIGGARLYDLGGELAVPVALIPSRTGSPWRWTLTPFFQAGFGVSVDAAAGGLLLGGGLVQRVSVRVKAVELFYATELAFYGGVPLANVRGYDFASRIRRLVVSHGIGAVYNAHPAVVLDVGLTTTRLDVDDAAVPRWFTPTVGLAFRAGDHVRARIAWESDLAPKYASHGVALKLDFLSRDGDD
ncbi:MAG: hypothetical protein R3F39_04930 [Myxococcota bacterium]